tara:strand:- start:1036 stop:1218 length:183 start_codon:yes stop_codon:yes gene_type:complete
MRSRKNLTAREISNATKTENVDSLAFFFDSFAQVHPNTQEKILKDMGFNIYRQFGTLYMN